MATSPLGAFSIPTCPAKSPNPAFSAARLSSQQHGSQCGGKPVSCLNSFPRPSLLGSGLASILYPTPLSRNSRGTFPPGLAAGAPGHLLTQGTQAAPEPPRGGRSSGSLSPGKPCPHTQIPEERRCWVSWELNLKVLAQQGKGQTN